MRMHVQELGVPLHMNTPVSEQSVPNVTAQRRTFSTSRRRIPVRKFLLLESGQARRGPESRPDESASSKLLFGCGIALFVTQ